VIQQVEQGSLVALANTGEKRSPLAPNIQTVAELEFPEATSESWFGLHAPAGTPAPILRALADAAQKAVNDPAVQKRIRDVGAEPAYQPAGEFVIFLGQEKERGQRFLKNIGHVPQ
jgi:tripartite-type tricarboxylate transporter receptor subunit TctC